MNGFVKGLVFMAVLIYFVLPDPVPGPIDDIILLMMTTMANAK